MVDSVNGKHPGFSGVICVGSEVTLISQDSEYQEIDVVSSKSHEGP